VTYDDGETYENTWNFTVAQPTVNSFQITYGRGFLGPYNGYGGGQITIGDPITYVASVSSPVDASFAFLQKISVSVTQHNNIDHTLTTGGLVLDDANGDLFIGDTTFEVAAGGTTSSPPTDDPKSPTDFPSIPYSETETSGDCTGYSGTMQFQ